MTPPQIVLERTWVPGTPRTWGDRKLEDAWFASVRAAAGDLTESRLDRFEVQLEFLIHPGSRSYRSQLSRHGPVLDILVKCTIDGLCYTDGRGAGIIPMDYQIYPIHASKALVGDDSETGVWITITGSQT